ncbi:hypothetical protein [Methyloprofundus sedimenti]|uniref:hypothetical protein n=1 Tax=Methyloprofundus sedimenti TaxID=1420851 RepID=UPI0013019D93|nr:hypothetical protein [Methyloprofundus sedimenti]
MILIEPAQQVVRERGQTGIQSASVFLGAHQVSKQSCLSGHILQMGVVKTVYRKDSYEFDIQCGHQVDYTVAVNQ